MLRDAARMTRAESTLRVDGSEIVPGRPNVVARVNGTGGGRTLMLNAHMDTVVLGGPLASLDPVEMDGRLYGRGSFDMKGSLAAAMLTAADYRNQPGSDLVRKQCFFCNAGRRSSIKQQDRVGPGRSTRSTAIGIQWHLEPANW